MDSIGISPAPGNHESYYKKVGAIPCGCKTNGTFVSIFYNLHIYIYMHSDKKLKMRLELETKTQKFADSTHFSDLDLLIFSFCL